MTHNRNDQHFLRTNDCSSTFHQAIMFDQDTPILKRGFTHNVEQTHWYTIIQQRRTLECSYQYYWALRCSDSVSLFSTYTACRHSVLPALPHTTQSRYSITIKSNSWWPKTKSQKTLGIKNSNPRIWRHTIQPKHEVQNSAKQSLGRIRSNMDTATVPRARSQESPRDSENRWEVQQSSWRQLHRVSLD